MRSGEEAWGDSLSVQARQHQEKDAVDQRAGGKENEVSFQAELLLRLNLLRAICQKQFCRKQFFVERQFSRKAKEPDGENLVNSPWTTC